MEYLALFVFLLLILRYGKAGSGKSKSFRIQHTKELLNSEPPKKPACPQRKNLSNG